MEENMEKEEKKAFQGVVILTFIVLVAMLMAAVITGIFIENMKFCSIITIKMLLIDFLIIFSIIAIIHIHAIIEKCSSQNH